MGQKVNPISNRLGVIRGWDSNWYDVKKFADNILEDSKLRKYLNVRLAKSSVSRIIIERTLKHLSEVEGVFEARRADPTQKIHAK